MGLNMFFTKSRRRQASTTSIMNVSTLSDGSAESGKKSKPFSWFTKRKSVKQRQEIPGTILFSVLSTPETKQVDDDDEDNTNNGASTNTNSSQNAGRSTTEFRFSPSPYRDSWSQLNSIVSRNKDGDEGTVTMGTNSNSISNTVGRSSGCEASSSTHQERRMRILSQYGDLQGSPSTICSTTVRSMSSHQFECDSSIHNISSMIQEDTGVTMTTSIDPLASSSSTMLQTLETLELLYEAEEENEFDSIQIKSNSNR